MAAEQNEIPLNEPPQSDWRKRKRWLGGLTLLFLSLGFLFLLYWLIIGQFSESTDDAYVSGNLVQIMSRISGHVTTILADETDLVTKGEPLVLLDKADAEVALKEAEAKLALTARQVSQLFKNVEQLEANVMLRQDELTKAKEDFERRQGLVVNKVISREDLQHAKIAVDTATDDLLLAKHQLEGAIALVENSDLYHHPQTQQAASNVRNAYLALQRTTIYAPAKGYIARRSVQVGQEVTPNTVLMVMVPLDQIWVDANFKESQLNNIRAGQSAELVADAFSSITYHGTVSGLSPGTGSTFDLLPPQNATGNWIKIVQRLPVRIAVDPEQLDQNPLRLGLSVTVSVNTRNRDKTALTKMAPPKNIYQTEDSSVDLEQANQLINKILQENAKNINYKPSQ